MPSTTRLKRVFRVTAPAWQTLLQSSRFHRAEIPELLPGSCRYQTRRCRGAERSPRDIPNAFIGQAKGPAKEEVSIVLRASAKIWKQFVDWMAAEQGVGEQE
jgi:hypothetical protein